MNKTTNNTAFELLKEDADKIKNLINKQSHTMCISQCKAFEEVIDTQMYGLSKQVLFAVRLELITNEQGQELLAALERDLNQMYSDVYDLISHGGASDARNE